MTKRAVNEGGMILKSDLGLWRKVLLPETRHGRAKQTEGTRGVGK